MPNNQLIVALDLPSSSAVKFLLPKLPPEIAWYKIGLELYASEGPLALAPLQDNQKNIFLDLKFHDIPNTVSRAVRAAAKHNISLLTVHALGGKNMLKAAVDAAKGNSNHDLKIIAVTILTSHSQDDLEKIGIRQKVSDQVLHLAELALVCGVDGLVASVEEAAILREKLGRNFLLIVPGIRPAGAGRGDQQRVATPAMAVKAGADFLVVGRPILAAQNPHAAATAILDEIAKAKKQDN
jgi:orotidine-5'-phosphate decarboxylase